MKNLLYFCTSIFLLFNFTTPQTFAAREADPPKPGLDYTVFRTVNNLSCHPQNPNIPEIPHLLTYEPNAIPSGASSLNLQSKGYCVATHTEPDPHYIGVVGGTNGRPLIPWLHYQVMEAPNPLYKVANEAACSAGTLQGAERFCGKYTHFEGYVQLSLVAHASSTHEAWHFTNPLGAFWVGRNTKFEIERATYTPDRTTLIQPAGRLKLTYVGAYLLEKLTYGTPVQPVRPAFLGDPSDNDFPVFSYSMNAHAANTTVVMNPAYYADIPHDRFGNPTASSDTSWVKCREQYPSGYFGANFTPLTNFNPTTASVKAVAPTNCEYPSIAETQYNIANYPTCINQNDFGPGVRIPSSMDGCIQGSSITPPISFTPTPSISPTSSFKQGDIDRDGDVDIFDYNFMVTDFGRTGTNGFIPSDIDTDGDVDIFDYNYLVSNFGS